MPVSPKIAEGLLIGLKNNPAAPPQVVASSTSASQAVMASSAMMPMFPTPIPVIPFGIGISTALTLIEAMKFESFTQTSQISNKLMDQYSKQLKDAQQKRQQAEQKLYDDLKTAQTTIKEELSALEAEIARLKELLVVTEAKQTEERTAYTAEVFKFKEAAFNAEKDGNIEERDTQLAKINELEPWLAQVIQLTIDMINLKLQIKFLELDLAAKQELANLQLKSEWNWMESKATDFNVIVPYHPDVPTTPNLPQVPPIAQEDFLSVAKRQIFAKWCVAPMIPPIGLILAAIQIMIQSMNPVATPASAAQAEAQANSSILTAGGAM